MKVEIGYTKRNRRGNNSSTFRTYYYTGSWRNDVSFNPDKVTNDKPLKYNQKVRARSREEAIMKFAYFHPERGHNILVRV